MSDASYHRDYEPERVVATGVDSTLIRRLLHYMGPYKGMIAVSIVLLLFAKTVEVVVPIFIGRLSERILETSWDGSELATQTLKSIAVSGLWIVAMLTLGYLLDAINIALKHLVGQKALLTLRQKVFDTIQRMPIAFFDGQSVGRLMSRSIHDVDQINELYSEGIVPLLGNLLLLTGIFVGVCYLNWKVTVITLLIVPGLWWLTRRFRYYQRRCFEQIRAIISALNTFVQEQLSGISTIWGFGSHERERKQFEEINSDHYTANIETIRNFATFAAGIEFFHSLVLVMIFAGLVLVVPMQDGFQAGQFFTFSLYALMVFRPIADLAERYNVLQSAMASGQRVFDILDRESEDHETGLGLDGIESISFDAVWFAYQDENWILHGLNLQINKGDSLALVGMTGAGKTTIISLLLRFYDVQKGAIRVNGRDIRDYKLRDLRRQFSVVLQDPVLFSRSLADNIALGQTRETGLAEDVEAAVSYVGMDGVVAKYTDGLQHCIHGRGASLSAGERQLVSLARACAHAGSVYVLDEATSNIDSESEKRIRLAMQKIVGDRTSIVIAHRLSTVQHVKRIAVLHEGRLVEEGTHDGLLAQKGIYEKLYRLQFSNGH